MLDAIDEDINAGLYPTHALSLTQPWAYFMLSLPPQHLKRIENRSWGSTRRGAIWVHAAKGMTRKAYDGACDYAVGAGVPISLLPPRKSLQLGGIVGRFRIVDMVIPGGVNGAGMHDPDLGPWYMGEFGYRVIDATPVPFVPCKGALGFWRVPHEVLRALAGDFDAQRGDR